MAHTADELSDVVMESYAPEKVDVYSEHLMMELKSSDRSSNRSSTFICSEFNLFGFGHYVSITLFPKEHFVAPLLWLNNHPNSF